MKYLMLIRHAKSNWDDPGLPDHDRPLNERGLRAAPIMGRFLSRTYLGVDGTPAVLPPIDFVVSSTAVRALSTAKLIMEAMAIHPSLLELDDRAYLAEPRTLLQIVQELDPDLRHVIVVGHNPGISEFASRILSRGEVDEMPTCATALIEIPVDSWSEAGWHTARLVGFVTPRLIEKRFMGEVMGV
jgi:phosphohistidine phosphatase